METKTNTPNSENKFADNSKNLTHATNLVKFLNAEAKTTKKNLSLTFRWNEDFSGVLPMIMGTFFLSIFLFYLPQEISDFANSQTLEDLISLLFRVGLVLLTIFLLFYYGLGCLINKTVILLTPKTMTIKHIPLFWSSNKEIKIKDLATVYTTTSAFKGKNRDFYDLRVVLKNGKEIKLITSVLSLETVGFLEKQIKQYLLDNCPKN